VRWIGQLGVELSDVHLKRPSLDVHRQLLSQKQILGSEWA